MNLLFYLGRIVLAHICSYTHRLLWELPSFLNSQKANWPWLLYCLFCLKTLCVLWFCGINKCDKLRNTQGFENGYLSSTKSVFSPFFFTFLLLFPFVWALVGGPWRTMEQNFLTFLVHLCTHSNTFMKTVSLKQFTGIRHFKWCSDVCLKDIIGTKSSLSLRPEIVTAGNAS